MNRCVHCHKPIDWDDATCPHCGGERPHTDPEEVDGPLWPEIRWRLLLYGLPAILAILWLLLERLLGGR